MVVLAVIIANVSSLLRDGCVYGYRNIYKSSDIISRKNASSPYTEAEMDAKNTLINAIIIFRDIITNSQ